MSSASDLVAHLKPLPIQVEFAGRMFTIEAMDAVDWIMLIDGPEADLYEIFPVRAGREALDFVEDALWDGTASTRDVADTALEAIAAAADRPWWVTIRLIASAKEAWSIVHVNNAAGMSLAGWLDQLWSKIMERIDPKKMASWVSSIESTPKGYEGQVDYDDEERAFIAAMNAVMR